MFTQRQVLLRKANTMLTQTHDVFLGDDFAVRFESRDHARKNFRKRTRKDFLAQRLAQHAAREWFAFVMLLQFNKHGACETIKTLTREVHTPAFNHRALRSCFSADNFEHFVGPTSRGSKISKVQTSIT